MQRRSWQWIRLLRSHTATFCSSADATCHKVQLPDSAVQLMAEDRLVCARLSKMQHSQCRSPSLPILCCYRTLVPLYSASLILLDDLSVPLEVGLQTQFTDGICCSGIFCGRCGSSGSLQACHRVPPFCVDVELYVRSRARSPGQGRPHRVSACILRRPPSTVLA